MIDLNFEHVSKRYLVQERENALGSEIKSVAGKLQKLRRRYQEFWAVQDVSFNVEHGEALGIIGHNGAGKSTILKLLSSITAPTSGEIMINGRLSALIEVGSGFHPELTGRENIYLSGSILGMRRREITDKLESIVDFAGVQRFIDTPVKRYSSGMYVRLGFSIAAHLDPDILLLDEVLAVGDGAFQTKCLNRINELKKIGTTIVFISHDLTAVEHLCDRVLLMHHGQLVANGPPRQVIREYQKKATEISLPINSTSADSTNGAATITRVTFHDAQGEMTTGFSTGEPVTVKIGYTAYERIPDAVFELYIWGINGGQGCQLTTSLGNELVDLEPGSGSIEFTCEELGLQQGNYNTGAVLRRQSEHDPIDDAKRLHSTIHITPGTSTWGDFYMPHKWKKVVEDKSVVEADKNSLSGELASHIKM